MGCWVRTNITLLPRPNPLCSPSSQSRRPGSSSGGSGAHQRNAADVVFSADGADVGHGLNADCGSADRTCGPATGSSLKTGPARPGLIKILQQLIHMNLSNYLFITDSIVLLSTTCRLLALHFMHEIWEISDVRFMPEISLDKFLTLNSTDISP